MLNFAHLMKLASIVAILGLAAAADAQPTLSGGTGTIFLGGYSGHLTAIDEATEKVVTQIPLKTGPPFVVRLSLDRSRFYVQSANQEHVEVVDVASRKSLDSFTLSDANRHVRAMAFDVDPDHHTLVMIARTDTKRIDRWEIGPREFIQYDLNAHKVVREVPWQGETEPQYYMDMRFSPNGKLLYVFADEVLIFDAATLQQVDSWNLSLPNEPGLGRFDPGESDESADQPGSFTGLFTRPDPITKRRQLGIGKVNLSEKNMDFFELGPAPRAGSFSFAIGADRARAYMLWREIGNYQLWTVDMAAKRVLSRVPFNGRPRVAVRSSSNGKVVYLYEAGNTIDLYAADGFKYMRTIRLDADMMYGTFYVLPSATKPPATPR